MLDLKLERIDDWSHFYTSAIESNQILSSTLPHLKKRLDYILNTYGTLLSAQEASIVKEAFRADDVWLPFYLIHSSLEYALDLILSHEETCLRSGESNAAVLASLIQSARCFADTKIQGAFQEALYAYDQSDGPSHCEEIFPSPKRHDPLQRSRENPASITLLNNAKQMIKEWNPAVLEELELYVYQYAIGNSKNASPAYQSIDEEPGHIKVAPQRLFHKENNTYYEPGSLIETVLFAGQIVHESRHQKGFYFNRIIQPTHRFDDSPFIKRDYQKVPAPHPFGHLTLGNFIDAIPSVGFELQFMQYALKNLNLTPHLKTYEEKIARKKRYLQMLFAIAQWNSACFTKQGASLLETFCKYFQS